MGKKTHAAGQAEAAGADGGGFRTERDALGEVRVPAHALWGAQTQRAIENFPISGLRPLAPFVAAQVRIKRAAAVAHRDLGRLEPRLADAIVAAADAVLAGQHREHFVVDPYQAGAGTSHNMNCNEVLANLANESLGAARGANAPVHPNDHVNMGQSTNDTIPTAIRLAALEGVPVLESACRRLVDALLDRAVQYDDVVKAGRTHLQDAMPIRVGQEFVAWAGSVRRAAVRVQQAAEWLLELPLGGSAVGTGVNTDPGYPKRAVDELASMTGQPLREATDRVQAMQSLGDVLAFSGALRGLAVEVGKVSSDLRLLASGPRTGLDELRLPPVQPGSSIMPGKVNPSIPEMVEQVCVQVEGCDATVASAAARGQLELNVFMPVIAHNVVFAQGILANAIRVLADRCVADIRVNAAQCAHWVERSAALATALAPRIGYAAAAELTKRSVAEGVTVRELVVREGVLSAEEAAQVLDLRRMTEPGVPGEGAPAGGG